MKFFDLIRFGIYNVKGDNMEVHTISPIFDKNSKILILGSFPSVKSREQGFFYGHPQNRFWRVLSAVFNENLPTTIDEKKEFLLKNKIAVWDVIQSCDIDGSSDNSIKNVCPNDLTKILPYTKITRIFVNGKTAENYYKTYMEKQVGVSATLLPSTSPANAVWSFQKLADKWKELIK